jgi:hypothetical protein
MKTFKDKLSTLKGELEFVDHGGYRTLVGLRQPLFCMETGAEWKKREFFADSPSCPKEKYCACDPQSSCTLMSFVPVEQRHQTLPCHHIPLNDAGETIASLEKSGNCEKIEAALKMWLVNNIEKLEERTAR